MQGGVGLDGYGFENGGAQAGQARLALPQRRNGEEQNVQAIIQVREESMGSRRAPFRSFQFATGGFGNLHGGLFRDFPATAVPAL